jgi:hypothetical protein
VGAATVTRLRATTNEVQIVPVAFADDFIRSSFPLLTMKLPRTGQQTRDFTG